MRQQFVFILMFLGFTTLARAQAPATRPTLNPNLPTLWIAGDSTAASGNRGWGFHMSDYLDTSKINIANRSVGGRSTRTFLSGGTWDQMLGQFKPGDYVIIQFGHNDISDINDARVSRGVIQSLGDETQEIDNQVTHQHEVVHTFGWYMRKFIADTQSQKAIPIVMSMTVRNNWTDGKVERGAGEMARFAIQVAKAQHVQFIDLNNIVADVFETMGQEKVNPLFNPDKTHSTVEGADFNASYIVAGMKALKDHPLDQYLTEKGKAVAAVTKYAEQ